MNPKDFDRIRFITRHFKSLQGLAMAVPMGLMQLGLGIASLLRFRPVLSSFILLVSFCGAIVLWRRAEPYYREIFGEIERSPISPLPTPWSGYLLVLMISALVFAKGGLTYGLIAQISLCIYGAMLLGLWIWRGCRRSQVHWLVFGTLFLGVQLFASSVPEGKNLGFASFLLGAAMILGGLLDHRFLVREMGQLAASLRPEAGAPSEELGRPEGQSLSTH